MPNGTHRFYSVLICQMIFLINGEPSGVRGLTNNIKKLCPHLRVTCSAEKFPNYPNTPNLGISQHYNLCTDQIETSTYLPPWARPSIGLHSSRFLSFSKHPQRRRKPRQSAKITPSRSPLPHFSLILCSPQALFRFIACLFDLRLEKERKRLLRRLPSI